MEKKFSSVAAREGCGEWARLTARETPIYEHGDDLRTPFERDGNRLLHCNAYRRLKHKTQVFYNIDNDHVCTRMEHVAHVQSVSETVSSGLGLNVGLARAIALGHDIGHAPFGHEGEHIISDLSEKYLGVPFWHERNGLRFADRIELLEDNEGVLRGLDLTYAVRDGIISHCGETDEYVFRPRSEYIDLESQFTSAGQFQPYTWEGCVVKIADRIAYVGRDIEDALSLGFLSPAAKEALSAEIGETLNTSAIMGDLIRDICASSSPEEGIRLSRAGSEKLGRIKEFNWTHIYSNERFGPFCRYCTLIINELFNFFDDLYDGPGTVERLLSSPVPGVAAPFAEYLARYCSPSVCPEGMSLPRAENAKIYGTLEKRRVYRQAVIDYISGMTDRYAVEAFEKLLEY